jgi:hypothetical protein
MSSSDLDKSSVEIIRKMKRAAADHVGIESEYPGHLADIWAKMTEEDHREIQRSPLWKTAYSLGYLEGEKSANKSSWATLSSVIIMANNAHRDW